MARRRSKRPGEVVYDSSQRLPRAHESVQRLPHDGIVATLWSAISGLQGMGGTPMVSSAVQTTLAPLAARKYGQFRSPYSPFPDKQVFMRAPSRVRFCVQRKQRRESLFAFGRAGFRGSAPGKYYRTQDSQYSCDRR